MKGTGKPLFIAALLSFGSVSCVREAIDSGLQTTRPGEISFTAKMGDEEIRTRSGASVTSRKAIGSFDLNGQEVFLNCEETPLGGPITGGGYETKGTPVNSSNFDDVYGAFAVDAYQVKDDDDGWGPYLEPLIAYDSEGNPIQQDGDNIYFYDVPFVKNGGKWTISSDFADYQSFYWPKKDWTAGTGSDNFHPLSFFAYAPEWQIGPKEGTPWYGAYESDEPAYYPDGRIEFWHFTHYDDVDFENDAQYQPDHLLASTGVVNNPQAGLPVNLTFYHMMSGIRFKVADDFPKGNIIYSISINGIWDFGKCSFNPNATGTTSADKVSWTFPTGSDQSSYHQLFGGDYGGVKTSEERNPSEHKIQGGDFLDEGDLTRTFMLIPQSFGMSGDSPEASITIAVSPGTGYAANYFTIPIPKGTKWEAGKLYTYVLSLRPNDNDDDVKIEIVEDFVRPMENTTYNKEDVSFVNTDTGKAYLRAAVLAYEVEEDDINKVWNWWKDKEQWLASGYDSKMIDYEITEELHPEETLWNTWAFNTEDWFEEGGYFYYKYPLEPNEQTSVFFDALRVYCMTTKTSEVDIISQSLPWYSESEPKRYVEQYWGSAIASQLQDSPKP